MTGPTNRDDISMLRPSPDALLIEAGREGRGRLKIFMGAAPGVGKTYEMLTAAAALKRSGVDVVAAIVETHGRRETEALVQGLETIARKQTAYRDQTLTEMDIDAVLARRPQVALVDELAHTNAPGSRHAKRWMDIEELLAAGIDVYTTLNVQHVESLNDVVAQITRIRIRETVPDSIIDAADQIELIDLTPDDLIKRLQDGKVYVPAQAERALKNFFKPASLTALRELALRRTADRVEDQVQQHRRVGAIEGQWATNERVLVCISDHPTAPQLVRYARRAADRLHARWSALYIEGKRHLTLSEEQKDRVSEALRLTEQLGGEAIAIPGIATGRSIADEIIDQAIRANVTHIIVGKSRRSRWFQFRHGSVVDALVRNPAGISIHVVAEEALSPLAVPRAAAANTKPPHAFTIDWLGCAVSVAIVGAATALGEAASLFVQLPNIALVYLTAVLVSAVSYGLWPSLLASLASALAYNFFFIPPIHTFTIADPANVLSLVFFFAVAVLVSNLTGRARQQEIILRQQSRTTVELYAFSRRLAGTALLGEVMQAAVQQIETMLKLPAVILMPKLGGTTELEIKASHPADQTMTARDFAAAHWTYSNGKPSGYGSDTLPGGKWLFLPVKTEREVTAVLALRGDAAPENGPTPALLTPRQRRSVNALIDQVAVAIERVRLVEDIDAARLAAETERLRSALLASLSHDLRTPLASILGAITSLRGYNTLYTGEQRDDLLATAEAETERLNRFVGNLLDMTKLESGVIVAKLEPVDLGDLIGTVLRRVTSLTQRHRVMVRIAPDFPEITVDHTLMEQVLFNLIDNAAKFAPPGSQIAIDVAQSPTAVTLTVADEGPGIPEAALEQIFDKFYRIQAGDRQRAGTGLGLSICRGMLETMGGTIRAYNKPDAGGTVLAVTLPAALIAASRVVSE